MGSEVQTWRPRRELNNPFRKPQLSASGNATDPPDRRVLTRRTPVGTPLRTRLDRQSGRTQRYSTRNAASRSRAIPAFIPRTPQFLMSPRAPPAQAADRQSARLRYARNPKTAREGEANPQRADQCLPYSAPWADPRTSRFSIPSTRPSTVPLHPVRKQPRSNLTRGGPHRPQREQASNDLSVEPHIAPMGPILPTRQTHVNNIFPTLLQRGREDLAFYPIQINY